MNVQSKTGKGDSDFTFKGLQCKEWLSIGRLSDQEKWCRRRGISVRGMPKYNSNRSTNSIAQRNWFEDLLNTPSKMFDYFAADDIIDVAREWHSEFYNLEGITDSKVIRELFYSYVDENKSQPLEYNRVYPPDHALDKVEIEQ